MSDEFDPLNLHLRGETACQTQMWIRSQLEIFWAQLFPNFPELTRSKIVCEIGTCIQSVKQWNKSAKEDMGTILFLFCWNKLIFIQEKT